MTHQWRSGLSLGVATLIAIVLIATVHWQTRAPIEKSQRLWSLEQLSAVLPEGQYDNNPVDTLRFRNDSGSAGSPLAVYTAYKEKQAVAFVMEALAPDGYSGDIRLLLGIDVQGNITGVRVIQHRETPGLGDDIDLRKSDWVLSFNGQSLKATAASDWNVKQSGGQFDAFTGATITPRAVITAIHQTLIWFDANYEWMVES